MQLAGLPCYVEGFDPSVNLRDLGGWPTAGGGRTRRGLIYRSGRLSELLDAELVRLMQLRLRCLVDLRPADEAAVHPDPRLLGVSRVSADAGRDVAGAEVAQMEPAQVIERATRSAVSMAFGNRGIRRVLELLVDGQAPLLFHCNSGRDRSGVCAMVVLMALGCSDEVLLADYALTNAYRAEVFGSVSVAPEYEDLVKVLVGVLPAVGQAVLDAIDARYPSCEAYLGAEYGLDAHRLTKLRTTYCEC